MAEDGGRLQQIQAGDDEGEGGHAAAGEGGRRRERGRSAAGSCSSGVGREVVRGRDEGEGGCAGKITETRFHAIPRVRPLNCGRATLHRTSPRSELAGVSGLQFFNHSKQRNWPKDSRIPIPSQFFRHPNTVLELMLTQSDGSNTTWHGRPMLDDLAVPLAGRPSTVVHALDERGHGGTRINPLPPQPACHH